MVCLPPFRDEKSASYRIQENGEQGGYRHGDTLIRGISASYRIQEKGEQGGYRHWNTLIGGYKPPTEYRRMGNKGDTDTGTH